MIILKSLLLGFLFTLPIGPIGIMCVRKILQFGRLYSFLLGLSQVLVILICTIITILCQRWFSDLFIKYKFWILLLGGFALIGFGIKIFFVKSPAIAKKDISKKSFIVDFFYTASLMLITPSTIPVFAALFSILKLNKTTTVFERAEILFFILIGSILCWTLVCLCFFGHKKNTSQKVMTWINRSAGVFLVSFGIAACISAIF